MVINEGAADDGNLKVGDTATVLTPAPVQAEIVGIVRLGDDDSTGGATFAGFTLAEAQRLFMPAPDDLSSLYLAAEPGVSQEQLVANVRTALPDGVEAITGHTLTEEDKQALDEGFLNFFEAFLLVFAGIALLVGTFSIYNTFSILIAQRTRESALLRAIGASRAQVLRSITLEALVIGFVASMLGLAVGVGLAAGLLALMDAAGMGVPSAALAVGASTVIWSFAVGVLVTLVASVAPAVRASRVPPIAALREIALDRSGVSKTRLAFGALFTAGGVALVVAGAAGGSGIGVAGLGAFLTILGFVVFGPVVARPAAAALGAPLPVLRRMTGKLARQNAMRNPRRTSATASALMVGIGVVTLFTVLAASVKVAVDDTVTKQFGGDLVINTNDFSSAGMSPALANDIGALPQVASASGLGIGTMTIDGQSSDVTVVEPASFAPLLDLDVTDGSIARARARPDRGVGAGRAGPELVARRHRHRCLRHRQRQPAAHDRRALQVDRARRRLRHPRHRVGRARGPAVRHRRDDRARRRCVDGRRQGGGATGGRPVLRTRRADAPGVRRQRGAGRSISSSPSCTCC